MTLDMLDVEADPADWNTDAYASALRRIALITHKED